MPKFYMILTRKINKIPQFCTIFARKMPEFYIRIAPKNFPEFWGHVPSLSPSPTPMSILYDNPCVTLHDVMLTMFWSDGWMYRQETMSSASLHGTEA